MKSLVQRISMASKGLIETARTLRQAAKATHEFSKAYVNCVTAAIPRSQAPMVQDGQKNIVDVSEETWARRVITERASMSDAKEFLCYVKYPSLPLGESRRVAHCDTCFTAYWGSVRKIASYIQYHGPDNGGSKLSIYTIPSFLSKTFSEDDAVPGASSLSGGPIELPWRIKQQTASLKQLPPHLLDMIPTEPELTKRVVSDLFPRELYRFHKEQPWAPPKGRISHSCCMPDGGVEYVDDLGEFEMACPCCARTAVYERQIGKVKFIVEEPETSPVAEFHQNTIRESEKFFDYGDHVIEWEVRLERVPIVEHPGDSWADWVKQ